MPAPDYLEWFVALFLNAILISFAQRLPILTRIGWVHAGALGTILWGCLGWRGWLAVVIYLFLGSLVTRIGFAKKQLVGLAEKRGGARGPENVWGSAATGTLLAILIKSGLGFQSKLLIGFAASFSSKLADTFGSEIGKRWGRKAFLITTFRPVPPGTEGAISIEGTIASVFGSLLMTSVMVGLGIIPTGAIAILVFLISFIATLLESLIGAVAQDKINWLSNELVNFLQTSIAAALTIFITVCLNL